MRSRLKMLSGSVFLGFLQPVEKARMAMCDSQWFDDAGGSEGCKDASKAFVVYIGSPRWDGFCFYVVPHQTTKMFGTMGEEKWTISGGRLLLYMREGFWVIVRVRGFRGVRGWSWWPHCTEEQLMQREVPLFRSSMKVLQEGFHVWEKRTVVGEREVWMSTNMCWKTEHQHNTKLWPCQWLLPKERLRRGYLQGSFRIGYESDGQASFFMFSEVHRGFYVCNRYSGAMEQMWEEKKWRWLYLIRSERDWEGGNAWCITESGIYWASTAKKAALSGTWLFRSFSNVHRLGWHEWGHRNKNDQVPGMCWCTFP